MQSQDRNSVKMDIHPSKKINSQNISRQMNKLQEQQVELDVKITNIDENQYELKNSDYYLLQNQGAIDYIFNLKQQKD